MSRQALPAMAGMFLLLGAAPATFAGNPDSPVATSTSAADKLAVAQLERRWIADIDSGNRNDLAMVLTDEYRDIDWRGRVRDKQALLTAIAKPTDTSQHIRQLHVRAWGDTAVATGINEVRSATKGWSVEISFTDVFARIDGHWRAVSSQETPRRDKPSGS